jgi:hypothetical protein
MTRSEPQGLSSIPFQMRPCEQYFSSSSQKQPPTPETRAQERERERGREGERRTRCRELTLLSGAEIESSEDCVSLQLRLRGSQNTAGLTRLATLLFSDFFLVVISEPLLSLVSLS